MEISKESGKGDSELDHASVAWLVEIELNLILIYSAKTLKM